MFIAVEFKRTIRSGDKDIIECAAFANGNGRLAFFREQHPDGSGYPFGNPFLSIALDQIAIWEVLPDPDNTPGTEKDEPRFTQFFVVPLTEASAATCREAGYGVGFESGTFFVRLPILIKEK
jgi:hypothetical protein